MEINTALTTIKKIQKISTLIVGGPCDSYVWTGISAKGVPINKTLCLYAKGNTKAFTATMHSASLSADRFNVSLLSIKLRSKPINNHPMAPIEPVEKPTIYHLQKIEHEKQIYYFYLNQSNVLDLCEWAKEMILKKVVDYSRAVNSNQYKEYVYE